MDDLLELCFVEALDEPVRFIDILRRDVDDGDDGRGRSSLSVQSKSVDTFYNLKTHIDGTKQKYSTRFISICQPNSWQRLQITRPMMDLIASEHSMDGSVYDLTSSFYRRGLKLEETSCIPLSQTRNGPWVDISYTLRYPEFKRPAKDEEEGEAAATGEWTIRQTGISHHFNTGTDQHVLLLFSPIPDSKLHLAAQKLLQSTASALPPFWLHDLLFTTHLPAWRHYIASLEHEFLPISNTTFSTFIDEPLRIGFDNLSSLISIEARFAQITTLLSSTTDTLTSLAEILSSSSSETDPHDSNHKPFLQAMGNYKRQCDSYANTASYLRHRAQTTSQFLANTLSYRDQVIAKEQNGNMLQLNKSAVFITIVTLTYVPASFVASVFGTNFFDLDAEHHRIVGTPMIWIFVVAALVLTIVSGLFYYWLVRHDGLLFWRLAPKMHKSNWSLKRATNINGTDFHMMAV